MVGDCVGEWMDGVCEDYDGFLMLISRDGNLHGGSGAIVWVVGNYGVDGADGLVVLIVNGFTESDALLLVASLFGFEPGLGEFTGVLVSIEGIVDLVTPTSYLVFEPFSVFTVSVTVRKVYFYGSHFQ